MATLMIAPEIESIDRDALTDLLLDLANFGETWRREVTAKHGNATVAIALEDGLILDVDGDLHISIAGAGYLADIGAAYTEMLYDPNEAEDFPF